MARRRWNGLIEVAPWRIQNTFLRRGQKKEIASETVQGDGKEKEGKGHDRGTRFSIATIKNGRSKNEENLEKLRYKGGR